MELKQKYPKRKSIRLKNYDYTSNGYYFITICTKDKKPYIEEYKKIMKEELDILIKKINGLKVDYSTFMPNHIHLILILEDAKIKLGEIVRRYKAVVTLKTGIKDLWQRNYYEHIIRNEKALLKIREYIQNNPEAEKINFDDFY